MPKSKRDVLVYFIKILLWVIVLSIIGGLMHTFITGMVEAGAIRRIVSIIVHVVYSSVILYIAQRIIRRGIHE